MESITLSLPKVQAGRLSLTISKKLLVKLGETLFDELTADYILFKK